MTSMEFEEYRSPDPHNPLEVQRAEELYKAHRAATQSRDLTKEQVAMWPMWLLRTDFQYRLRDFLSADELEKMPIILNEPYYALDDISQTVMWKVNAILETPGICKGGKLLDELTEYIRNERTKLIIDNRYAHEVWKDTYKTCLSSQYSSLPEELVVFFKSFSNEVDYKTHEPHCSYIMDMDPEAFRYICRLDILPVIENHFHITFGRDSKEWSTFYDLTRERACMEDMSDTALNEWKQLASIFPDYPEEKLHRND